MHRSLARLAFVAAVVAFLSAAPAQEPRLTIRVAADITEAARRIVHARLVIPAKPGPLTLVYPKWLPGTHSPMARSTASRG
jgi:hypothetical protein